MKSFPPAWMRAPDRYGAELRGLLERAAFNELIADTHHTTDYAGREHGWLRAEGELVPLGAMVIRSEGMSWQQGHARLQALAAAVNALPRLLDTLTAQAERLAVAREALEKIANGDEPRPVGKIFRGDGVESKHDRCIHGEWMYNDCGACMSEVARAAVERIDAGEG